MTRQTALLLLLLLLLPLLDLLLLPLLDPRHCVSRQQWDPRIVSSIAFTFRRLASSAQSKTLNLRLEIEYLSTGTTFRHPPVRCSGETVIEVEHNARWRSQQFKWFWRSTTSLVVGGFLPPRAKRLDRGKTTFLTARCGTAANVVAVCWM
jgi:hypothetical protein